VSNRLVLFVSVFIVFITDVGCSSRATAQVKTPPPPVNASSADALLTRTRQSIVSIMATNPGLGGALTGTGFIVSADGDIVTCNHVVNNGGPYFQSIQVTLPDGSKVNATVTGAFSQTRLIRDYALLKINRKTPEFLELSDIADVKVGEDIIAWGYPLGLPGPVLIKGSVATTVKEKAGDTDVQAVVFQGPNNKGMSGGPVILSRTGRVIGITSNRIAGIGRELDDMRRFIQANGSRGGVMISGVDTNAALLKLTETLDQFLMSGMGVAITVDHIRNELPSTPR